MRYPVWPLAVVALVRAAGVQAQAASAPSPATPGPATPAPAGSRTTVHDVVVEAQRPTTQTLLDRKVYTVSGNLQATTGSAADILNQLPSINVDADGKFPATHTRAFAAHQNHPESEHRGPLIAAERVSGVAHLRCYKAWYEETYRSPFTMSG